MMLSYRWAQPSVSVRCMLRTTGEVVVGGNSQGLCRCQGVHGACTHTHVQYVCMHTLRHMCKSMYVRDDLSRCFVCTSPHYSQCSLNYCKKHGLASKESTKEMIDYVLLVRYKCTQTDMRPHTHTYTHTFVSIYIH